MPKQAANAAQLVMTLAVTAQVAVTAWCVREIVHVKTDVAAIKANRFKGTDAIDVWQEIGIIREKIARLEE